MILLNNLMERVINILQAVGERSMGRSCNDTVINRLDTFNDTETTDAGAGIDTEDTAIH